MTGCGVSRWKSKDCYIEVVVQSYNSKHFESRVQIPPFYASLEGELRKHLQKKFNRGFINLLITRNPSWPVKKTKIRCNKDQALKWKVLYNQLALLLYKTGMEFANSTLRSPLEKGLQKSPALSSQKRRSNKMSIKLENSVDLMTLAQQPGVMEVLSQPSLISAEEKNKLKALTRKAMDLCNKERIREGLSLKKDFQKNIKHLGLCIQKIKSHSNRQNKKASKNVKEKARSIDITNEQNTVQDVMVALINRMDNSEELSRMEEHIQVFRTLILSKGVIGKKISFYLQEMIREVNTIGSKSQDFKLTQEVVQSKTLIERMREQVHNVE